MAGHFDPDPVLCRRYARFAAHLKRQQFKVLYWTMFMTNLLILFFASWVYIKSGQKANRHPGRSPTRLRALRTSIILAIMCVFVSTAVVVMEAFALLALQFCDGEDLMSLYWSTWTMVQVGSLIAIVGIVLALFHSLRDVEHPPWALALGTPVLVIAGFLHLFHDCTRKSIQNIRRRSSASSEQVPSTSKEATVDTQADVERDCDSETEIRAEIIGSTASGGNIVRFLSPMPRWRPPRGEIIGYAVDDRPIVAFAKGAINFMPGSRT